MHPVQRNDPLGRGVWRNWCQKGPYVQVFLKKKNKLYRKWEKMVAFASAQWWVYGVCYYSVFLCVWKILLEKHSYFPLAEETDFNRRHVDGTKARRARERGKPPVQVFQEFRVFCNAVLSGNCLNLNFFHCKMWIISVLPTSLGCVRGDELW